MLLAFRFLTGFFGSPALATGGASIADMYRPKKQVYGLAVWGIGAVCGPVLGPLVGGFAVMAKGWTWTIWELMWLSGFCWVFLFFFFPETSAPNILHRRTRRLKKLTGDDRLTCEADIMSQEMSAKDVRIETTPLRCTANIVVDCQHESSQALHPHVHGTHRVSTEPIHCAHLRTPLHLVRVIPLGL